MKENKMDVKKGSSFRDMFRRLAKNKTAMLGGAVLLFFVIIAILAPYLAPYDYAEMDPVNNFMSPCVEHWFGTDEYGRDVFSRMLIGTRYSLVLGFGSSLISTVVGLLLGAIAGYFGGRVDYIIMRILDIFQSIPMLLMTIVISVALGSGLWNTVLAMGIAGIAAPARIIRASILTIRTQEYLEACTAINCHESRIIFRHVLPNTISSVIVNFTMGIGMTIMGSAGLSFIGLGIQPPTPEWGAMLVSATSYLRHYPYMVMIPGGMLSITVLAVNMFGDGLRDAMDPKLRN